MKLLDEIVKICPPPVAPTNILTGLEWNMQFHSIGTRLPEQLVQLNKLYGSGYFQSNQSPINGSFHFNCLHVSHRAIFRLAELRLVKLKKPNVFPARLYFEPDGLLPIGTISHSVDICLRTIGDNPDKWKISLLRATTNKVHHLDSSLLEFATDVLVGKLHSAIFSQHIPTTKGYQFTAFSL